MNESICGITVGNRLGSGAYSTVYAHPNDPDKVVMSGYFDDDLLKLNLYKSIDSLFKVSLDRTTGRYAAILTRMFDRSTDIGRQQIQNMVNLAHEIFNDARDQTDSDVYRANLEYLATDNRINDKAAKIVMFLFDHGIHNYHWDNHTGNWLVDSDGNCLPMDIFNCDSQYVRKHQTELTESISDKIIESES